MHEVSAGISTTSGPPVSNCSPIVFVVDDDISSRKLIELLTAPVGWQAKAFPSAEEFLASPPVLAPSCLVLHLKSLALQRRLADRPEIPIIFITDFADVPMTVQAMKAGAIGVLTEPLGDQELRSSIEQALERSQQVISQKLRMQHFRHRYASLTGREREVMGLVVSGLLNKQTGQALGISEITVKIHRSRVMRKMGARSLADLITMALRLDLSFPSKRVAPPPVDHYSRSSAGRACNTEVERPKLDLSGVRAMRVPRIPTRATLGESGARYLPSTERLPRFHSKGE